MIVLLLGNLFMALVLADDTGFKQGDNVHQEEEKGWLERHSHFIIIVVLGLLIFSLLIWYVVKSIQGMRKRLAVENEKHRFLTEQLTGARPYQPHPISEIVPTSQHGYQKMDSTPHVHRY
ncbi:hypothetical protein K492DRAFT_218655 [Lichtheimia hyalospora FSU 10163]|nr:hypothetical protein K492DRAFT_218655 [Lichtheimia hyalospora FSU 10163]